MYLGLWIVQYSPVDVQCVIQHVSSQMPGRLSGGAPSALSTPDCAYHFSAAPMHHFCAKLFGGLTKNRLRTSLQHLQNLRKISFHGFMIVPFAGLDSLEKMERSHLKSLDLSSGCQSVARTWEPGMQQKV